MTLSGAHKEFDTPEHTLFSIYSRYIVFFDQHIVDYIPQDYYTATGVINWPLTYWGRLMNICVSEQANNWFR